MIFEGFTQADINGEVVEDDISDDDDDNVPNGFHHRWLTDFKGGSGLKVFLRDNSFIYSLIMKL